MRSLSLVLLLACGWLCAAGCKSPDRGPDVPFDPTSVPCTCGDPLTDVEGCACPLCMSGQGNPDNPDCVCGTFDLGK